MLDAKFILWVGNGLLCFDATILPLLPLFDPLHLPNTAISGDALIFCFSFLPNSQTTLGFLLYIIAKLLKCAFDPP